MKYFKYFVYGNGEDDKSIIEKVISAYSIIETINKKAYTVIVCDIKKPLTEKDNKVFKKYLKEQYSDGWGEYFEEMYVKIREGIIYLSFLPYDFYIDT